MWLGGTLLAVVISLVAGYFNPMISIIIGAAAAGIAGLAIYFHAVENDCALMYRLVPLYVFYYTIVNIGELWRWALIQIAGVAVLLLSIVLMAVQDGGMNFAADFEDHSDKYVLSAWEDPAGEIGLGELMSDDFDDGYQEIVSPTPEQLKDVIASLHWDDPKLYSELYLTAPYRENEGIDEEIHVSDGLVEQGNQGKFSLNWTQYNDITDEEAYKVATADSVDEFVPALIAFLNGQPDWDQGIEWDEQDKYSTADGGY